MKEEIRRRVQTRSYSTISHGSAYLNHGNTERFNESFWLPILSLYLDEFKTQTSAFGTQQTNT